jgi:hypothetical protein
MSPAPADARHAVPILALSVVFAAAAGAAEVHSNGTGGGLWSEPSAWQARAVPKADDTAVISAGDTIVFDRDDSAATTCRDLAIDPGGALAFQPGGRRIMVLTGPIEAYGTIRLDATGSAEDLLEIRLAGAAPEQRVIRLEQEGSLMVYGRPGLPDGARNAALTCAAPAAGATDSPGLIQVPDGTALDLQRVRVADLRVQATGIDNTGGQVNERLNISDCRFEGLARVQMDDCDTPAVVQNDFLSEGEQRLAVAAITVGSSPLADIRGNTIRGGYSWGVMGRRQTDSIVRGNTIEGCAGGIFWQGTNGVIKDNVIRNCKEGMHLTAMTGLLEDNVLDGCTTGIDLKTATIQVTGLTLVNLPDDSLPIDLRKGGELTLVNTALGPEQVKMSKGGGAVETMQYLVVGIKGGVPAGAEVEVATSNPARPLPEGAADLNVRNSPAPVTARGSTPLPSSLRSLIVRGWSLGRDGQVQAEPEYVVRLLAPPDAAAPVGPRTTLAQITVTPTSAWHRPTPRDPTPTVEIEVPR